MSLPRAAVAHFVTVAGGQVRCFVAGTGPAVLVLPGLALGAEVRAAEVAAAGPVTAVALEPPGVGGSDPVTDPRPDDVARRLADAAAALRLGAAPCVVFDVGDAFAHVVAGPRVHVDADRAAGWRAAARRAPDLAPRPDGGHLTALWAHLRHAPLAVPDDPERAAGGGPALPDADALDRTVVAALERPERFVALWNAALARPPAPAAPVAADAVDALRALEPSGDPPQLEPTRPPAGADGWRSVVHPSGGGPVHVRHVGRTGRPLLVLQSAPGSAAPLHEVLHGLAGGRQVVAPDFPGNGGSPGRHDGPVDIAELAVACAELMDHLGHEHYDVWGTHTGALVGLDLAVAHPQRVGRLVAEAPPLVDAAAARDILDRYFPRLRPDPWGLHLQQAWNMRRDMFLFWPWYRAEREAVRPLGVPPPQLLHDWTIGLLQSGTTYDRSYRAAFEYDTRATLRRLRTPTLVCAGPTDMLADGLEEARRLAPEAVEVRETPATVWYPNQPAHSKPATLAVYDAFLRG